MFMFAANHGIDLPQRTDEVLPFLCAGGYLGQATLVLFTLGIAAAAFSSADSALTALTTSVCIDVLQRPADETLRRRMHLAVTTVLLGLIILFRALNSTSVIDAVYIIASYTYGPLLGLFAFGLLFRSRRPRESAVPWICVSAPILCYALSLGFETWLDYRFGYELLMLNGALVMLGLFAFEDKSFAKEGRSVGFSL